MPKQYQPPVAERIGAEIVRRITPGKLKPGDRIVEQSWRTSSTQAAVLCATH